jgi:hypothetical protein
MKMSFSSWLYHKYIPQTSPINWILFRNLIIIMTIINSVLFSYNFISNNYNTRVISYSIKKWIW